MCNCVLVSSCRLLMPSQSLNLSLPFLWFHLSHPILFLFFGSWPLAYLVSSPKFPIHKHWRALQVFLHLLLLLLFLYTFYLHFLSSDHSFSSFLSLSLFFHLRFSFLLFCSHFIAPFCSAIFCCLPTDLKNPLLLLLLLFFLFSL